MDAAKIRLSQQEMAMVKDAEIILTKNRILEKIKHFLAGLKDNYELNIRESVPAYAEFLNHNAKISRGENYKGLPYLVLDYPRQFSKQDVFAIRTMFWWGHFFSITLHISGKSKKTLQPVITNAYNLIVDKGYYVCTGNNEWEHHFENDNYLKVSTMEREIFLNKIQSGSYIKLAKKYPVDDWEYLAERLSADHSWLLSLLSIRRPGDGTGL